MSELANFPPETRVGIYNRVSTEKKVQLEALDKQVEYTRKLVLENHLTLVNQYVEPESGTEAEHRYEYQRMLKDIQADRLDLVVVKCSDRLCRSQVEWHNFIKLILHKNVSLYFYLDDHIYQHDKDDLLYSMQAIVDAEQSKVTSKKIRDIHSNRQIYAEGQKALNITRPILGWDRKVELIDERNKRVWWEVNEKEASEIRYAMSLVENGVGFYRLANIMFERGVLSKGTNGTKQCQPDRISATAWRNIITSPLLHGDCIVHKTALNFYTKKSIKLSEKDWIYKENVIPPIVSREYHQQVLDCLQSRTYKVECDKSMIGRHRWSNKIYCTKCHKQFYRNSIATDYGKKMAVWKCSNQFTMSRKACDTISVNETTLEEQLEESFKKKYGEVFHISSDLIEKTMQLIEKALFHTNHDSEKRSIEGKLNQLSKKKNILFEKLMSAVISDNDFKTYNDKLDEEIRSLTERIEELKESEISMEDKYKRLKKIRADIRNYQCDTQAILQLLFQCVKVIEIGNTEEINVTMDKEEMEKNFELYHLLDMEDSLYTFSFNYHKETILTRRRKESNEKIIGLIRKNPYITIPEMAEQLSVKYSYAWTSVKLLRDEGKLRYVKPSFHHEDCYWEVIGEEKGEYT